MNLVYKRKIQSDTERKDRAWNLAAKRSPISSSLFLKNYKILPQNGGFPYETDGDAPRLT